MTKQDVLYSQTVGVAHKYQFYLVRALRWFRRTGLSQDIADAVPGGNESMFRITALAKAIQHSMGLIMEIKMTTAQTSQPKELRKRKSPYRMWVGRGVKGIAMIFSALRASCKMKLGQNLNLRL